MQSINRREASGSRRVSWAADVAEVALEPGTTVDWIRRETASSSAIIDRCRSSRSGRGRDSRLAKVVGKAPSDATY